jgi:hypothetical protein
MNESNANYLWERLSMQYSSYRLTQASDKLPALSGTARKAKAILRDDYLAGHWRNGLPCSLYWFKAMSETKLSRPSTYRAPAWSWASVDGRVISQGDELVAPIAIAQVHVAYVQPSGFDPFGHVADGWLVLEAPLLSGTLTTTWANNAKDTLNKRDFAILGGQILQVRQFLDDPTVLQKKATNSETPFTVPFEVVILMRRQFEREPNPSVILPSTWPFCGLIVEPVDIDGRKFCRIGAFECYQQMDLPADCVRDITLI